MKKPIKRAGIIHDIVAFGKAGMMNILPVIAQMNVEACPIPTMTFSTHTAYRDPAVRVLDGFITAVLKHFKAEQIALDTLLVGYLGRPALVDEAVAFVRSYKETGTRIILDPIFADHGKLYANISVDYIEHLKRLLPLCDIVIPNVTEAAFLTGETKAKDMAAALIEMGCKNVIITGVDVEDERIDIITHTDLGYRLHRMPRVKRNLHGTGDVFAGLVTGYYTHRVLLEEAVEMAHEFIFRCITGSLQYEYDYKEGILLEHFLRDIPGYEQTERSIGKAETD
ncbi:MAG: PfkB family carbohydrate kinase [Eubacteriales bacterium]|nr:PfkB family carbohydrate kinase [Eubacteriales bacterium]